MSYVPPLYNDIGKKCKDLFNKKYNFGNSVVVKHKKSTRNAGTLSIETAGNFGQCGVGGNVKSTCDHKQGKLELNANSCGSLGAKFEATQLAPNLTVSLCGGVCGPSKSGSCGPKSGSCGPSSSSSASCDKKDSKSCEGKDAKACETKCKSSCNIGGGVSAEYRRESFAGAVGVCHKAGKTGLTASAVVGHKGFSVGGEVCADAAAGAVQCFGGAVQYEHADAVLSLVSENKFRKHQFSAYHPVNRDLTVGFQYGFDQDSKCGKNARCLGGALEYLAAPDTTIKARANTKGCAALNVEHTLANPRLLLGFSAGFALPTGNGGSCTSAGCPFYPDKFGVQVTFGDF